MKFLPELMWSHWGVGLESFPPNSSDKQYLWLMTEYYQDRFYTYRLISSLNYGRKKHNDIWQPIMHFNTVLHGNAASWNEILYLVDLHIFIMQCKLNGLLLNCLPNILIANSGVAELIRKLPSTTWWRGDVWRWWRLWNSLARITAFYVLGY